MHEPKEKVQEGMISPQWKSLPDHNVTWTGRSKDEPTSQCCHSHTKMEWYFGETDCHVQVHRTQIQIYLA